MRRPIILLSLFALALSACGGEDNDGSSDGGLIEDGGSGDTDGGSDGGTSTAICTEPTAVECEDQVWQFLDFKTQVAAGEVTNTQDGEVWVSEVDARAGGAFSVTDAYTYARFTDQGLVKLPVDDDGALGSMDWDIGFRRYVVRLNGGDSGPSCVAGARMPPSITFEGLTSVPGTPAWNVDDYMTGSCEFVSDGSGLESSPATVLAGYYSYPGCLQMTGNVYVIRLADGRFVKFTIEAYYAPLSAQETCEQTGQHPSGGTSAVFTVRWAFIPG